MLAKIIKKIQEHCRIIQYRENYICTYLNDDNREAAVLLDKQCTAHTAAMSDVCVIYNILDAARKKSGKDYPVRKIIGVVDVVLTDAAASGIHSVELAKRIVAKLFDVDMQRQEIDMIEEMTRRKIKSCIQQGKEEK